MSASPKEYGAIVHPLRGIPVRDSANVAHVLHAPAWPRLGAVPPTPLPAVPLAQPPVSQGHRAPVGSDGAVGREVRRLRRGQGKTLKVLAEQVGVTGAQLHRYETGATRIAASRLIAIADALGVRPDVLISAGSEHAPAAPAMVEPYSEDDDIVELIQIFGTITDPRHRTALVSVARMLATRYQRSHRSADSD